MQSIFSLSEFHFPYDDIKFPGQYSDEKILFITREGRVVLYSKLLGVMLLSLFGLFVGFGSFLLSRQFGVSTFALLIFITVWTLATILVLWWIWSVWRKTVFIITTKRLSKFIHMTPWSRYQMSLGLDKIVDTGAYQKGWLQMFTGLGYFVARSSAGAVKNFKIINIGFAEDLHNYVNKLLFVFNDKQLELDKFRPFIPYLKGQVRENFVKKTAPQYLHKK